MWFSKNKKMNILIGIISMAAGFALWAVAISVTASWWAFCFGSVIVGIVLLLFNPLILLAPLAITEPGNTLLVFGFYKIFNEEPGK